MMWLCRPLGIVLFDERPSLGCEECLPPGIELVGRWTAVDLGGGFALLETDDGQALSESSLLWSDLLALALTPVIEDAEITEVFRRAGT
jgi:hypothetical protein